MGIGRMRWSVAKGVLTGTLSTLAPLVMAADDLKYDPREAQEAVFFDQQISQARFCMRDAIRAVLMQGERESKRIVGFATQVCGSSLRTYMTQHLRRPEKEVDAFLQAMAYRELDRVPGLERSTSQPGGTPKPSARASLAPKREKEISAEEMNRKGYDADEKKNYAEAIRWYRKAADKGLAKAQANLGLMYEKGQGVPQDYSLALDWYRKAAAQGFAAAQHSVGYFYEKGLGVKKDSAQAVAWFRKAAEQGIAVAQHNLGNMYLNGSGVRMDQAEAMRWYRKAADQGFAPAQYNLGALYENGGDVPKDVTQARYWYNLAAAQGDAAAKKALADLDGSRVCSGSPC